MKKTIFDLVTESLSDPEEELDFAPTCPYMQLAFLDWLKETRNISTQEYRLNYVNNYISAYEKLYDEVEVDAYDAFDHSLNSERQPFMRGYGLAVFDVYYMETMQEMLDEDENAFTKNEMRAMLAYRDFMAEVTGENDDKAPIPRKLHVPYYEEFIAYLRSVGYKGREPQKMASRLKLTSIWFSPADKEGYDIFNEAASLTSNESLDKLMTVIKEAAKTPDERCVWKPKTIYNAVNIIDRYFDFLKWRNKQLNKHAK